MTPSVTGGQASRVVVAFDGSGPSRAALAVGIDEARGRGLPLLVVSAVDVQGRVEFRAEVEESAARVCEEAFAAAAAALGEDLASMEVGHGTAVSVLLDVVGPADLLVIGSRGHRPLAHLLLGSTSATLAEHAPCPVMIVHEVPAYPHRPVVVGVDFSPSSVAALEFAVDVARRTGTRLLALSVLPYITDMTGAVSGPDEPRIAEATAHLESVLAPYRATVPGLGIDHEVVQGRPAEALVERAHGARMLVVGSRGHGGLYAMAMGSVSRAVIHLADCPIVVIRTPVDSAG